MTTADAVSYAVFFICVTILIVLFGGEPDLMDALIGNLK